MPEENVEDTKITASDVLKDLVEDIQELQREIVVLRQRAGLPHPYFTDKTARRQMKLRSNQIQK